MSRTDKAMVLSKKGRLRNVAGYGRVYIRTSKTMEARAMETNIIMRTIANMFSQLSFMNGRLVPRVEGQQHMQQSAVYPPPPTRGHRRITNHTRHRVTMHSQTLDSHNRINRHNNQSRLPRTVNRYSSGRKTSASSSRRKTSATSSRRKTSATSSRRKISVSSSRRKTSAPSSLRKTSASSSRRKTSASSSRRKISACHRVHTNHPEPAVNQGK